MRSLIVNADDLGANSARSHGIFEAFEQGVVTSATLLANASDSERAARHAGHKDLPTGLHLNLTEGEPLSKPGHVGTLLEANGSFLDRHKLRRALDEGTVDAAELEREIRLQVEWFFDNRGVMTHLDGHHHVHVHPAVVQPLIPILLRYGVGYVRIPSEPLPPFGFEIETEQLQRAQRIVRWAEEARGLFSANGIASTDAFRGLALVGNASARNLRHVISRLPDDGSVELMVHPGSPTPIGTPFDTDPQRQTELRMLTDPELQASLVERKIRLCSYADLAV